MASTAFRTVSSMLFASAKVAISILTKPHAFGGGGDDPLHTRKTDHALFHAANDVLLHLHR